LEKLKSEEYNKQYRIIPETGIEVLNGNCTAKRDINHEILMFWEKLFCKKVFPKPFSKNFRFCVFFKLQSNLKKTQLSKVLGRGSGKHSFKKVSLKINSGPGKLCQALNITISDNGASLQHSNLLIIDTGDYRKHEVITGQRIGISTGIEHLYRFYVKDCPYVSTYGKKK
jgi:hypothetical protein